MLRIYKFTCKNKHNGIGKCEYKFYDFTDMSDNDIQDTLWYDLEGFADASIYHSRNYESKFEHITDKEELERIKEQLIDKIDKEIKELQGAKQLISNI